MSKDNKNMRRQKY